MTTLMTFNYMKLIMTNVVQQLYRTINNKHALQMQRISLYTVHNASRQHCYIIIIKL